MNCDQEYWKIAEAETPLLIDSTEKLQNAAEVISKALVVGIDSEWPPNETGHRPACTVLQLATWCPSQGLVVLVLDLLALDATPASEILQTLFRRKETLKIGYSFKADVFALHTALKKSNDHNGSVALIDPIIDIRSLHLYLWQKNCPGIHASGGGGLSGVVNAILGLPLHKSQQCSDWSCRPLTNQQLRYAATDAACLVALLGYFMQCWHHRQEKIDTNFLVDDSKLLEFSQALVENAAKEWGERWELVDPVKKKIQRTGGLCHFDGEYDSISSSRTKNNKKKGAAATMPEFPAFPLTVPWMDSKKNIIGAPLFLADVMLQGLARQLRLWGFDAEAVECVSKTERHKVHRTLVERAEQEGRIILTRDSIFMRRNLSDQAYFVKSEAKREQLAEIIDSFGLPVMQTALLSRCARCNGEFMEKPIAGSELALEHGVPPGVIERVKEFWVCLGCKKAYWQGSMYARAMENLEEALQSMNFGGGGSGESGGGKKDSAEHQVCLT